MDFTDWIKPIVSGAQNGASYGAKIRLPHAFVMTFLFQKGSLESKLRRIVQMALVHGRGLAAYAATYKTALALLALAFPPRPPPRTALGLGNRMADRAPSARPGPGFGTESFTDGSGGLSGGPSPSLSSMPTSSINSGSPPTSPPRPLSPSLAEANEVIRAVQQAMGEAMGEATLPAPAAAQGQAGEAGAPGGGSSRGHDVSPRSTIRLVREAMAHERGVSASRPGGAAADRAPPRSSTGGQKMGWAGRPAAGWHSVVAGAAGGYLVWGNYSGVNYQVTLYIASRVLVALARLAASDTGPLGATRPPATNGGGAVGGGANGGGAVGGWLLPAQAGWVPPSFEACYPFGCALAWGCVMWLWEARPDLLQPSLRKSMDEIYRKGDRWRGFGTNAVPSKPYMAVIAASIALAAWDAQRPRPQGQISGKTQAP